MALIGSGVVSEGFDCCYVHLAPTSCCSVGIVVPVYCTCKAIETKDDHAQHKTIPRRMDLSALWRFFRIKFISWCPYYYHVKFAFLIWLQLPSADGAKQLYMNHLRPLFLKNQTKIDRVLVLTYGELLKLISAHQGEIQYVRAMLLKFFGSDQTPRDRANTDLPQNNALEGVPRTSSESDSDLDD